MFVRPAPGRAVRDPETKMLISAEGRDVPRTGFWLRRLRDGDVIEGPAVTEPDIVEALPAPDEPAGLIEAPAADAPHPDLTDEPAAVGEQG